MKKALAVFFMFFVVSQANAALPRIAVMDLENRSAYRGIVKDLEGGTADMLVTALIKTRKFRVIERAELGKVLAEQKLGSSGAVTPQTAAEIGKILGVEYMVIGSVNEYGTSESDVGAFGVGLKSHAATVGLDIRVVDTASAEIVAAATGSCSKSARGLKISNDDILPTNLKVGSDRFNTSLIGQAARGAVDDAAGKIAKALGGEWQGVIVRVADGTVSINGGENAGIKVGDRYTVIRKGEEMKDPETGESLGSEDSVVGEIEIGEVKPKYANAKIISGAPLQNDKVVKK